MERKGLDLGNAGEELQAFILLLVKGVAVVGLAVDI